MVTKFKFTLPAQLAASHSDDDESGEADEDGDPNVRRRNHTKDHTLAIKHHVHTSLDLVGLQVSKAVEPSALIYQTPTI